MIALASVVDIVGAAVLGAAVLGRAVDLPVQGSAPSDVLWVTLGCIAFVAVVVGAAFAVNKWEGGKAEPGNGPDPHR